MRKTSVYLPDDLKASLEKLAREEGRSEAEIIRSAIRRTVEQRRRPRPTLPLFPGGFGDPTLADRVDELLDGFGES